LRVTDLKGSSVHKRKQMESNRWHVGREKKYEYVVDVLLI